ncbi:MAG: hypothetical protein JOZ31_08995 [Verrucomicrobia bacterium]|nr:hypothetical protein [Verrucomicrobiota bacterium]MBV8481953.1 hypothetical protein [Verrucomicrobiota bacterium]
MSRFFPVYVRGHALLVELVPVGTGFLFIWNHANNELFMLCMCLALGIQNDALWKTNLAGVHSTYITGMVTTPLLGILICAEMKATWTRT